MMHLCMLQSRKTETIPLSLSLYQTLHLLFTIADLPLIYIHVHTQVNVLISVNLIYTSKCTCVLTSVKLILSPENILSLIFSTPRPLAYY